MMRRADAGSMLAGAMSTARRAQGAAEAVLAARPDALVGAFVHHDHVPDAIAVVVSGDTTLLRGLTMSPGCT